MVLVLCFLSLVVPYSEFDREKIQEVVAQDHLTSRVRDMAIQAGLREPDSSVLAFELSRSSVYPPRQDYVEYFEQTSFGLFPFLKTIVLIDELRFERRPYWRSGISRLTVLNWIALCKDVDSSKWLVGFVEDQMKGPIETQDDVDRISGLLYALGYDGGDKTLDILFWFQSKETWLTDPPIQIGAIADTPESREEIIRTLRYAALAGLALSGSDRALRTFATGQGLAEDLSAFESMFDTAAHARLGMYNIPWHYKRGLDPGVEEKLRAIYEKYDMEYRCRDMYEAQVAPE
ncbi:MAG: hypothetical protein ACOX5J_03990 [Candidatus Hydrogenedentales bacterium]|jgi:hypothetical protein